MHALLRRLSLLACLGLLATAGGCEGGGGHTTTHIGVSYGYYGGWYDPYYYRPPGYRPVGPPPPGYRPPAHRPPPPGRPPGTRPPPTQLPSGPRPMPRGGAR